MPSPFEDTQSEKLYQLLEIFSEEASTHFSSLSREAKKKLFTEIETFRSFYHANPLKIPSLKDRLITPTEVLSTDLLDQKTGEAALKEEKIALLILAGGDGSRLGFNGPKGAFPILDQPHLSLFKILITEAKNKASLYQKIWPILILTSDNNDIQTKTYFESHDYFGYPQHNIYFLKQPSAPLIGINHKIILQSPDTLAKGPNGNGGFLQALISSSTFDMLTGLNISHLHIIPVDNPLAHPFDETLIGATIRHQADLSVRSFQCTHPQEKVGLVVKKNEKISIIDYVDLEQIDSLAGSSEPAIFSHANMNLFCMSLAWLKTLYFNSTLPYHFAKKNYPCYQIKLRDYKNTPVFKPELFITDLVEQASKALVLSTERTSHFCPLKNTSDILQIQNLFKQQK